jgi:hypothetical protein
MKVRIKALTSDCKKCLIREKDECQFGHNKVRKILAKGKGKMRRCNLIKVRE